MAQGTFFFDAAVYLPKRHKTPYFSVAFYSTQKTGYSAYYCFNPYLGVDHRGSSDVCP